MIRHDGFVTFPFSVKEGEKTCCDDDNLLHVHKMSRLCHVCKQKWLSDQPNLSNLRGFTRLNCCHDRALLLDLR